MKLSVWAKENGVCYHTAWKWFKDGTLPVEAQQLKTGTILITSSKKSAPGSGVALYCRVSSHDQKKHLPAQIARLTEYAISQNLAVSRVVTEVGSGLNGKRSKLIQLLSDPSIGCIVVEHRDRLTRFGFEYLETLMKNSGRRILVAQKSELKEDLVQDMIDVLTSFCTRLYGKRSARNKAKQALKAIEGAHGNDPEG